MKVYRFQHVDYDPDNKDMHRLLLDTLNYLSVKYPCPQDDGVFENDTRSCFKTEELAGEFLTDMTDVWYDCEEYDTDNYEENQSPEFYELLEYEIDKNDIVFIDDFQVIHKTT